jgi:hypothetical protein
MNISNIFNNDYYNTIKIFLPGASTGLTKILIGYPFETIKVKKQLNNSLKLNGSYKGLYRGCSIPLVSAVTKRSIQLNIYESLKCDSTYFAGGISGLITSIIMNPFNIIKVNIQSNKYNKIRDVAYNYRNIQKGFYINIIRDSLFSAYYLGTYGYLNNNLPNKPIYHSFSSIISGSSVWLFLIPFDYIRTNIQSNIKHKTLFSNIAKNPKILWNGVSYMIIKSLPVNLINMVIYEYLKEICS